jgi:hypothetical protein
MNVIPLDFNWKNYLKLNKDLNQHCSEEEAIEHYLNYGIIENRKYIFNIPNDFNWYIYMKLNKDLQEDLNEEKAIEHYLNFGVNENRKYKIEIPCDFYWKTYIKLNIDFPQDWNEAQAIEHYLNYGIYENRHYNSFNLDKNIFINYELRNYKKKKINILNYSNNKITSQLNSNEIKKSNNLKKLYNYSIINNNYILIIDFPNLGGGTEFFINTIITKYKNNQTFITVKNFNGKLEIAINNEYLFGIFNENYVMNFIKNSKNKIKKIFINHILGHSTNFLNFITNLNINTTTITHDYFLINENAQPYYNEINLNYQPKIDFNKINSIIIQNEEILNIYNNFLIENQNVIITPLPDYKKSNDICYSNNTNIVIGIIGAISNTKGSKLLLEMIEYIKTNNLNIKLIVFGKSNIGHKYEFEYNNIDELNNLLILHKPNLLFETSIWNETYSYTLSLSMITQLPILSFKKPIKNVIENRLKNYNKSYFYNNIIDFFEIVNNVKQNYFYTINPIIYFNSFWDECFS